MKHVRYTCIKKRIATTKKECEKCPEYNPCAKYGKWCFVGALIAENEQICCNNLSGMIESNTGKIMRDMSTVTINLANNTQVDVLKENILKNLKANFLQNRFYGDSL